MIIQDQWKLQYFNSGEKRALEVAHPDFIDHFWMTAKVPGDVHSTLLEKGLIEDPFFGHNDQKCRWVEEKEWWYRTEFFYHDSIDSEERVELTFEGLDTFATIYVNGLEVGSTENMLVEHTFDITRVIQMGRNVIAVKFDPVWLVTKEKQQISWSGFARERAWTRKAQMNYGWDWGPRLLTAGIWKPVRVEKKQSVKLDSVFATTSAIEEKKAIIDVEVNLDRTRFGRGKEVSVEVQVRDEGETFTQQAVMSDTQSILTIEVPEPKLWWTHDLGEPFLYDLEVKITDSEQELDRYSQKLGIRTIKLEQEDENGNKLFCFKLNGVRLFAKGTNWIPVHSFIGAAHDDRYKKLIQLSKESHMNMLRVWGGGIYEKDVFYQECDRQGLLVWQDFMFACALYPDYNQNFMKNVEDEIVKAVKRLRPYSCITLWCGNNENDWLWEVEVSSGRIDDPFWGETIYHDLIPSILEKMDPSRFYWPSSPFGGNDHDSEEEGDRHNWQVWHGNIEPRKFGDVPGQDYSVEGVSFKNYKKDFTKFSSEFGMHASSNRYTLERNIPEGQFYWKSDEMSYRNKDYHHQKGILLMEGYTGIPQDIEEYMNFSMLTQAEGLKCGIEHYRRNKPNTSGALVWQLNDCWPGTSWSMIDYDLLPKASYYYAQKGFFHPLLATLDHDVGEPLKFWFVNDTLEPVEDEIVIEVQTFTGEVVWKEKVPFTCGANESQFVVEYTEAEVLGGASASEVVVRLSSGSGTFPENIYYLRDHKDLALPEVSLSVELNQAEQTITISTDQHARFVKIDIPSDQLIYSEQFFDLLPGEQKVIHVRHLEGHEVSLNKVRVGCLNGKAILIDE
ncbi:glycoside hydrolase family 2 TIM barrel-domain containing protein [Bacillus carboniphilus]|uniref:Beta-mannosidase B n=1 Tax=Bacillus carboniphilus TaxID=86663 RepID=A0ABN0VSH9_9BACI